MPSLKDKAITLLGSATVAVGSAQNGVSTTIFTSASGKVTRPTHVIARDPTASLAGASSLSFTGFAALVDLTNLVTANTGYCIISEQTTAGGTAPKPVQYTELAANTPFQVTVNTGSTLAANVTFDVFGYTA